MLEFETLKRKKAQEAELKRAEKKAVTKCKAKKVQTFQCSKDGTRIVKHTSYEYSDKQEKCVEVIRRET